MSDVPKPTAGQVRAAAEALKDAIDRHLAAVERRTGESDPAVFAAYDELRDTAQQYEELLFDAYDEVTPFEFAEPPEPAPPGLLEEPPAISVLIRRDYSVADPETVLEAARESSPQPVDDLRVALTFLFDLYEPDDLDECCEDVGLSPEGSTLWVLATPGDGDDRWREAPFEGADEARMLYRLDVTVGDDDR